MNQRKYLLKKDPQDLRDKVYRSEYKDATKLPASVDLRSFTSPVVDQGQLGSCTANAIVSGLREYLELKNGSPLTRLSRLFLYWHERSIEGTVEQDSGAYIRDGMKVLQSIGCPPETDFPYDTSKFTDKPSDQAEADAGAYKINEYHRVMDFSAMQVALAGGNPVVLGISVYSSFESQLVAQTGKVPLPKRGEQLLGGHAVLAVGYKKIGRTLYAIVRNSWGTGWGDQGYFYLPKTFFDKGYVSDMWTGR
jgi:C1A family cysteine protease